MELKIRVYHPTDMTSLYRICLMTGNNGQDASGLYADPDLLGHFYAGPYAVLEPDLCFVLTCQKKPCGYILGASDSARYQSWFEAEWSPMLRERYPLPDPSDKTADACHIRLMHTGYRFDPDLENYPAHLHIDLLPEAQGKGLGRQLMETFIAKLREKKVPGLHLIVGSANTGAVQFYQRVGFEHIKDYKGGIAFGMKLHNRSVF